MESEIEFILEKEAVQATRRNLFWEAPGHLPVPGKKRGVPNRCEMLWVCNVFATTFRVTP